jgi:branched-chain amino acid transport system ATP-binding protein
MPDPPALECFALSAGWGETQILSDISFALPTGRVLAVLGRNGVGKTTLLSALMGRASLRGGSIRLHGTPIERLPVYARAKLGLGFVPQEREIFPSLSVRENLLVAARPGDWQLSDVLDLFPRLAERRDHGGHQLSGGEQQMLSIGRALMGNTSVLLLDEPMEGLAPVIVDQLIDALHRLAATGTLSILLVEQHVDIALEFTSDILVLDRGRVAYEHTDSTGTPNRGRIEQLLGIGS